MPGEHVTIASYLNIVEAHLARSQLEDCGIKAVLSDEATVYMAWHLTNAIHGIKLSVRDADAAQARAILADDWGAPTTAAAKELESMIAHEPTSAEGPSTADDDLEPTFTWREEIAERAFRGAVIGIWLVPWQLYVTWLLARVYFSDERLEPAQRRKAYVAAAINFLYVVQGWIFLKWMLGLPVFMAQV